MPVLMMLLTKPCSLCEENTKNPNELNARWNVHYVANKYNADLQGCQPEANSTQRPSVAHSPTGSPKNQQMSKQVHSQFMNKC
jgi:hypothetical protein